MNDQVFGGEVRRLRTLKNISQRALAKRINVDAGTLSRIETGKRMPTTGVANALDSVLDAAGSLIRLASVSESLAHDAVFQAADESMRFAQWASAAGRSDRLPIDSIYYEIARIASAYVYAPLQPLFTELQAVRDQVWWRLREGPNPRQTRELFFLGGATLTLLAHVTDNLGNPVAAMQQAMAADQLAEQADHTALRAWIAGTQALIAEWSGNPVRAVGFASNGLPLAPPGHQRVRLNALEARSAARLGRKQDALDAIRRTEIAAEAEPGHDDLHDFGGILAFPAVKARYYAGTTHRLVGQCQQAETYALEAIDVYVTGPREERSYGDEALARVDVAIARIMRGELDGARDVLVPVLTLPAEQRIRAIGDGLQQVNRQLNVSQHAKEPLALAVSEEITLFDTHDPQNP